MITGRAVHDGEHAPLSQRKAIAFRFWADQRFLAFRASFRRTAKAGAFAVTDRTGKALIAPGPIDPSQIYRSTSTHRSRCRSPSRP